jgi:hypothetical protein
MKTAEPEGQEMTLTKTQILVLAATAGFTGPDQNTAAAIALAESSGNPAVIGDITLGDSIGLWQINLRWHPEYTEAMLLDPQTNANAAYLIYKEADHSFTPWSTFKSGAYKAYL